MLAAEVGGGFLRDYVKYPIVQCLEFDPELPIPHVLVDNYAAAWEVIAYPLGLEHRRIGRISSENRYISTRLRMEGYRDSLISAGISPKKSNTHYPISSSCGNLPVWFRVYRMRVIR